MSRLRLPLPTPNWRAPASRVSHQICAWQIKARLNRTCVRNVDEYAAATEVQALNHLLTGAMVAALAIAAPAWAQSSIGGNTMAPSASASPASMSDARPTGAPRHRQARARHATHARMAGRSRGRGLQSTGGTANQLNQEELGRLQAGNVASQPTAPSPAAPGNPASSSRMPGPKSAGSGYIPPQPGAGAVSPEPSPKTVGPGQGAPR